MTPGEFALILLYLSIFIALFRYVRVLRLEEFGKWTMSGAFLIKFLAGLIFLYVYSVYYGNGSLSADAGAFMKQSETLNRVFYSSPADYFRFMTGIGETEELIFKHLSGTHHWQAGTLTLVNDNKNLLRFHSLIHFVSGGSAAVHLCFMLFFSVLGCKLLYRAFLPFVSVPGRWLFWGIVLLPGALFWTSSILKEPLLFFGVALFCYVALIKKAPWKRITGLLIALFLLLSFKPYVLICMLVPLLVYAIHRTFRFRKAVWSLGISLVLVLLSMLIFRKPADKALHILSRKQFDFINVGRGGMHVIGDTSFYYFRYDQLNKLVIHGGTAELKEPVRALVTEFGSIDAEVPVDLVPQGKQWPVYFLSRGCSSFIEIPPLRDSWKNLALSAPQALFNGLFRPLPGDPGSRLKYLAMCETLLMIVLTGVTFFFFRVPRLNRRRIVLQLMLFMLILSLLIGWTTPVLGAVVRYRFPVYLAWFIVLCMCLDMEKIHLWKQKSTS